MRHALVTGGGGFVGRVLCRQLAGAGVQVSALHRRPRSGPWQRQLCVDLGREALPAGALIGIDTVFHLAGHAHAGGGESTEALHRAVTVDGTRRLLDALAPTVRRIVFASSTKAMGEETTTQGLDESAPAHPTSAYGRARLAAEGLLHGAANAGLSVTVLRLPLVYGPGVGGNLGRLLRAVRSRWMPTLPAFGNRRSMIHVQDVVRAAVLVASQPRAAGATYVISDGEDLSGDEVVRLMYAALGARARVPPLPVAALRLAAVLGDGLMALGLDRVPFDSDVLARLATSARFRADRIREETGFVPERTLAGALPEMFDALGDDPR